MSRIELAEIFRRAIDVVENARIPYLVYGGLALPAWGSAAKTEDVDLVVQVDESGGPTLIEAFRKAGFQVPDRAELLLFTDTWTVASMGGRDVDLALGATPFDAQALARAVSLAIFGRTVPVATAEDLVLYKLAAYRFKDLGHVEDIITRQADALDKAYLRRWAETIAAATGKFEIPRTLEKMLGASEG